MEVHGVGTNVGSDAPSALASDYGDGFSITPERTHAFAMKSHSWLMSMDPRTSQT
ncbi:hypothetical protein [Achromobacter sp.]|uniref:hypothetical protein n=1 Tax=Achromobacter sp. TaxID=134375 RepID=UPI0039B829E8